jgi:hypothetical protein
MMGTLAALGDLGCCIAPFLLVAAVIGGYVFLLINSSVPGGLARGKQMQAAATQLGWSYVNKLSYQSIPGAASLHLFAHGTWHRIGHMLSGTRDGTQMSVFDHQFKRAFLNAYFLHTVVLAASGGAALPSFVLRTTSFLGNLGVKASNQITFPNHPTFSRGFVLMGTDEPALRRIFSDAVIDYCETHPGLCLENANGLLFVFRQGVLAPPQSLTFYLDEANTLLRMFASGLSGVPMPPPPLPPPIAS